VGLFGNDKRIARHICDAICPAMCNDFGNRVSYDDYLCAFSQIKMPLRWPEAAPHKMRITQRLCWAIALIASCSG
jgi:hypothetical protein